MKLSKISKIFSLVLALCLCAGYITVQADSFSPPKIVHTERGDEMLVVHVYDDECGNVLDFEILEYLPDHFYNVVKVIFHTGGNRNIPV